MAVVAGDLTEITYNHPTLGNGVWSPKSAEDFTFDPGGFRTNDDANQIDGAGRAIYQKNRVRWSAEGTVSWDMNSTNEIAQAEALAANPVEADFTFTHINGTVWKGKGMVVGDVQGNSNAGTMDIKISGGGKCKKIVG